ncbi:MAG: SRPBCC family protein, partial [Bryobacteraceae bacterium]
MLKKILTGIFVALVILAGIVAIQPSEYRVQRSATISASPAEIFPLVNDFHKWDGWSPWAKLDPAMRTTYGGPPAGPGTVYTWTGNDKAGEGRMTITDSNPNDLVRIKLEFLKPFPSTSTTDFTFRPESGGTAVTWDMKGGDQ